MPETLRIGIIGFDTSHATAFTKLLNDSSDPHHIPGAKVIAGFPSYSPDVESSRTRVEGYTRQLRDDYGLQIMATVESLIEQVDAVLLESVDGRRHLDEARPVIEARKPLFIDKPLASNYYEAKEIVDLAESHGCPIFSSSSLRYDANIRAIKNDQELGEVWACDAFSPAVLDPSNPGLFWYGIHGVEILYTFMGTGCESVLCHQTEARDVVRARWEDGRCSTLRGTRKGAHDYGATVFGSSKVASTMAWPMWVPTFGTSWPSRKRYAK